MRAALLLAAVALAPAPVLANGAFPDTERVLLPADRPQTLILGTNFGLIVSEDGGAHWRWTCEHGAGDGGYRYTFSTDQRRLIGQAGRTLVVSEDLGCHWSTAGSQKETIPFDFFPDGADPAFALALIQDLQTGLNTVSRVDLRDPSAPPAVLHRAAMGEDLTTLESAASDPRLIYATLEPPPAAGRTRLLRSGDGGQTWTVQAIEGAADHANLQIAAVDPRAPARLYFRARAPLDQGEALLISEDAGKTVRVAFTTTGALAAFLPLADGALLATQELGVGQLFRLEGTAFVEATAAGIGARGFAERAGLLYAATDNLVDGFALAVSRDRGRTWQKVMAFADIEAISRCGDLPAACLGTCAMLVGRATLKPSLCMPPAEMDAGADVGLDAPVTAPKGGGCACRLGRRSAGGPWLGLLLLLASAWRRSSRAAPGAEKPRPGPR
jgi:photosystem II stability/assembly factor-like uncharacterized protein